MTSDAGNSPGANAPKKLVLGIATAILLFGASEGAARILLPPRVESSPVSFVGHEFGGKFPTVFDTKRFWKLPANVTIPELEESINSRGFRGPAASAADAPGVTRVLCLGDSNVFGVGVALEDTFCHRLSRWAAATAPGKVEIINAGVPAYSIFQILQTFRSRDAAPRADVVLVYAGAWNDYTPAIGVTDEVAYSKLIKNGGGLHLLRIFESLFAKSGGADARRAKYTELWSTSAVRPDGPRVPPDRFEFLANLLIHEIKQSGARPVFVIPPAPADTRKRFADSDRYAEMLKKVCAAAQTPVVDARARIAERNAPDAQYFMDMIHPTPPGHSIIASEVARALLGLKLQIFEGANAPDFESPPILLKSLEAAARVRTGDPLREVSAVEFTKKSPRRISGSAPLEITWEHLNIPPGASLICGILFKNDAQGAMEFEIRVNGGAGEKVIYQKKESAAAGAEWSPVRRVRADLAEFGGREISLTLRAIGNSTSVSWINAAITAFQ